MRLQTNKGLALRYGCLAAAFALTAAFAVSSFKATAQDSRTESAHYFEQMTTVFDHARCMNCHANAAFPTQGDDRHRHTMNIARGSDDHGAAGLHCGTCHQAINQTASGVPGAPDWHLAPVRMAWSDLTPPQLCRALFDPAHGGMKPDQLVAHFNTPLVRWAWSPGTDAYGQARTTPPLTHEQFISVTEYWIATGAVCPD